MYTQECHWSMWNAISLSLGDGVKLKLKNSTWVLAFRMLYVGVSMYLSWCICMLCLFPDCAWKPYLSTEVLLWQRLSGKAAKCSLPLTRQLDLCECRDWSGNAAILFYYWFSLVLNFPCIISFCSSSKFYPMDTNPITPGFKLLFFMEVISLGWRKSYVRLSWGHLILQRQLNYLLIYTEGKQVPWWI